MAGTESRFASVEGLRLHYLEAGEGEPVLLLHGWPTSSFLWRHQLEPLAEKGRRAIALDLPGFGRSDKPLDASYSFRFYDRILDGFCAELGLDRLGLAVHDLGGPVGMHWAAGKPERITDLALLNTLLFKRMSPAVMAFVAMTRVPGVRSWLSSPAGLRFSMRTGMRDHDMLTDEVMAGVLEPFESKDARKALLKAGHGLHPSGFETIEAWLPRIGCPVRIVYGADDRILPDVAKTMRKAAEVIPGKVETTEIPDCGHFLQEDRPEAVAEHLAAFFARS